MAFSAIIAAPLHDSANAALEAEGYGPENFSVPLWNATDPIPAAHGLNASGSDPDFRAAVEAIPNVSIRDAAPGAVEFNEHVASLGLQTEQVLIPGDGDLTPEPQT
jgi:hypothetical protein